MKKVALHNLGCKVNSYETEVMRQALQEKGYQIVPFEEEADIYIVNTCTVTNIADRKSRQMLHRAKQKNPEAVVVAVGCYVQTGRGQLETDDCVDLLIGNNRKNEIAGILEAYLNGDKADKTLSGTTVPDLKNGCGYERMRLTRTAEHTRAYIKIQDGCNQFCSYCAIPLARGRVRSRSVSDVLEEIRNLAAAGYREAVLTGIHLSSYGTDFEPGNPWGKKNPPELIRLLDKIQEIPGLERIRLGSLEPGFITADTAARLASFPGLCPHFHLSLQSGCDETLKRMNRHYTVGEYWKSVEDLRHAFDSPAITTDVIVGFPGETEEEFETTRNFLEKTRFYEMHIFKYSRRTGTAAAKMPDQVPEEEKTARSDALLRLEKEMSREFRGRYIGKEARVLWEETKGIRGQRYLLGYTGDYVRVAVLAETADRKVGELETLAVKDFLTDEILLGEIRREEKPGRCL